MTVGEATEVAKAMGVDVARIRRGWWSLDLSVPAERDTLVRSLLTAAEYAAIARGLEPGDVPDAVARGVYYQGRHTPEVRAVAAIHHHGLAGGWDGPAVSTENVRWHARRGLGADLPEVKALLATAT